MTSDQAMASTSSREEVRTQPFSDLVAAEIRAQMARQQVTGEALAEAMGTSANWVSRRLRGRTAFAVDELDTVATLLGVPLAELLTPALTRRDHAIVRSGDGVLSDLVRRVDEKRRRLREQQPSTDPALAADATDPADLGSVINPP